MERLLIRAANVITSGSLGVLSPGAVIVEDGAITAVDALENVGSLEGFSRILGSVEDHVVLPGFVNGHEHSLRPSRMQRIRSPLEISLVQSRRRRLCAPLVVEGGSRPARGDGSGF